MIRSVEDRQRTAAGERVRTRDVALRRTRRLVAGVAVAAVGLSGLASVVAARTFKGHQRGAPAPAQRTRTSRVQVPAPDRIPSIVGDPVPLQAPAQPPAPAPAAPAPQVSGGS
jgi:hypothetical protein